jgi:hypothetical protein
MIEERYAVVAVACVSLSRAAEIQTGTNLSTLH